MIARRDLIAAAVSWPVAAPAASGPPPVVTILGDSIAAGLGLPEKEALPAQLQAALDRIGARARVRGAGVSGDTTAGGLGRLGFSVRPDTAVCVVELGANDYLQSVPAAEIRRNLTAILTGLKRRGVTPILAAGAAPKAGSGAYGREFDLAFKEAALETRSSLAPNLLAGVFDKPGLRQADGVHPNAEGVRIIAARLAPMVARALLARSRS